MSESVRMRERINMPVYASYLIQVDTNLENLLQLNSLHWDQSANAQAELNLHWLVCLFGVSRHFHYYFSYPFPSYDISAADDFEHILSTNRKSI